MIGLRGLPHEHRCGLMHPCRKLSQDMAHSHTLVATTHDTKRLEIEVWIDCHAFSAYSSVKPTDLSGDLEVRKVASRTLFSATEQSILYPGLPQESHLANQIATTNTNRALLAFGFTRNARELTISNAPYRACHIPSYGYTSAECAGLTTPMPSPAFQSR